MLPSYPKPESPEHISSSEERDSELFVVQRAADTAELVVHFDEHEIQTSLKVLERRIAEISAARMEAENRVRLHAETETRFRVEVALRRRDEEEHRRQEEEDAARLRAEEDEKLEAEYVVRTHMEHEARILAEEEARLRLEVITMRKTADELVRRRAEIEDAARATELVDAERTRLKAEELHTALLERLLNEEEVLSRAVAHISQRRTELETLREESEIDLRRLEEEAAQLAVAAETRNADAERRRREAEEAQREAANQLQVEQERLTNDESEVRRVAGEVALRKAALESARLKTEEDNRELLEAETRMKVAEESCRQVKAQRLQLEAQLLQQLAAEQCQLEEVSSRLKQEQQNREEAARIREEEEQQRLGALDALHAHLVTSTNERAETERNLTAEIERLRLAELDARRRIEEAELSRRRAEETYSLTIAKLQRVEAEAHARAAEEARILAKLEDARRNVAAEAQAREEQEKRIKEEIESLRRFEEEQRQRMAEESRRRLDAEASLQREKDRYKAEEDARIRVELQLELTSGQDETMNVEAREVPDDPDENLRRLETPAPGRVTSAFVKEASRAAAEERSKIAEISAESDLPESIIANLSSPDPDERQAAVAALPSLGLDDAFKLIVVCFDDPALQVRNAAARALRELDPHRPVEPVNRALDEGSPEQREGIARAIVTSGLAAEAVEALGSDNRDETYNALCLLFAMAKSGELEPLVRAVEEHQNVEVRRAAVKLLTITGQAEVAEEAVKRRLNGRSGPLV